MEDQKCVNIRYKHSNRKRKDNACLVNFSNGRLKTESDDLQFKVYVKESDPAIADHVLKKRRALVANTSRMDYVSTNCADNSDSQSNCNYFLCVVNKRKKKMKIYDTSMHFFKPVIDVNDDLEEKSEKSFREKVDDLTSKFGSKAKKRSMNSRNKHQVDVENMTELLSDAVEKSVTNSADNDVESATTDEAESVLPPINKEAEDPADVYCIFDIIPSSEYEEIEPKAAELMKVTDSDIEEWKKEAKFSKFVLYYLEHHRDKIYVEKAKLLVYYNYLLQYFRLGYKNFTKKDPCPEVPEPFKSSFFDRFVVESYTTAGRISRTIPQRMKDKIMSYALVISLFVNDFMVDLILFQSDFKCGVAKLIKLVHAMGCHVVYPKTGNSVSPQRFAQLKFPLFVGKVNYVRTKPKK